MDANRHGDGRSIWTGSSNIYFIGGFLDVGRNHWHVLTLLTNASSSYSLSSHDKNFLFRVKQSIELAMEAPEAAVWNINMSEHKIDKRVTQNVGAGGIAVGGNVSGSTLSTNVVAQGLQDVSALIGAVETANIQNAEILKSYLETVRSGLAGGRTKDEARSAWSKFVDQAGSVAKAGNHVWDLIAKIGPLLA